MTRSVLDPARYPLLPPRLLAQSRVLPDRWAALPFWPQEAVIAEIGVGLGQFTEAMLEVCRPRRFIAIDRFDLHELPMLWGVPPSEFFGGRTHKAFYADKFAREIARGQVELIEGDSAPSIAALPDDSVDIFYVDADHTYEGAKRDLEALLPKVRADGWIIMNDYIPVGVGFDDQPYGVIQATNEFMIAHGWEMTYLALAQAMYCDVGLRRIGAAAAPLALPATAEASPVEVALLKARVAGLQQELDTVHRSNSWRLTAPLRAIRRSL